MAKEERDEVRRIIEGVTHEDEVEIEGDFAKKIIKIHATGNVVWGALITAVSITALCCLATVATGGSSSGVTVPAAAASSATTLGIGAVAGGTALADTMLTFGIVGGVSGGTLVGIKALNEIRKCKIIKLSDTHIILKKR